MTKHEFVRKIGCQSIKFLNTVSWLYVFFRLQKASSLIYYWKLKVNEKEETVRMDDSVLFTDVYGTNVLGMVELPN